MRVSVIIPCYNAEAYLASTLSSVLEQSHPADEVIVVDDGSTDGSLEVAHGFGHQVRTVEGPHLGAAAARNRGADTATGDALMFLDSDDLLDPNALAALTAALRERTDALALCPWFRLEHRDGRWMKRPPSSPPRLPGQDPLQGWLCGWYHPPCAVLWSRGGYDRAGGWDESITVNDDGELVMRALAVGVDLVETRSGAAYYRRPREGEQTLSGAAQTEAGLHSRMRVLRRVADLLAERGTIERYRFEIGLAYDPIARDSAGQYPKIARAAAEWARIFAGPPWRRGMRRIRDRQLLRAQRIVRTLREPRSSVEDSE